MPMKSLPFAVLALLGPAACSPSPQAPLLAASPQAASAPAASAPAASPPPKASASSSSAGEAGATRVQVKVTSCLPVGFGVSCACELDSRDAALRGPAQLESCVGSGDATGLTRRLEAAPIATASGPPLSLWLDVRAAPATARYCGVLIVGSGAHFEVVEFER